MNLKNERWTFVLLKKKREKKTFKAIQAPPPPPLHKTVYPPEPHQNRGSNCIKYQSRTNCRACIAPGQIY